MGSKKLKSIGAGSELLGSRTDALLQLFPPDLGSSGLTVSRAEDICIGYCDLPHSQWESNL